ncbi:glycosyl transferase [Bacillus endophyticus]|uniref:glycosyltransferase family 2 protein n=1 Tax=Priestia endophytica TaxID=135735 RepID=UPI0018CF3B7F|nr:glycosyltransferase [Priestia endophytica]MBG9814145.1 glycosyl transferase [Priestia endophytica]
MQPNLSPIKPSFKPRNNRFYVTVTTKFWVSHALAIGWTIFALYLSLPWLRDLSSIVSLSLAILIIGGIAYVPGYMNAFLIASLLLDRQPVLRDQYPSDSVTMLIAAYNEEKSIFNTLQYVANQDYLGKIHIIVINNNSTDHTDREIIRAKKELNLDITLLHEYKPGKFHALNKGLQHVMTPYVITLDADTLLHPSSIRYLVSRIKNRPSNVSAVAGSMLVRNSRETIWTRIQEWDYFLGIASIKRLQGLYQGTLVAQGAFSLYKTECVREVQGWPDAIGEDIVLTWRLLHNQWKVYFEPLAVAFTDAPPTLSHFVKQRSRWARGMIEGLIEIKPWNQPQLYTKYLTGINFMMPYLDFVYTFCWIPGLILAFFGFYWIVGPLTLLVLPLTIISYSLLYTYQRNYVFKNLGLKVRRNTLGFILFVLCYQMIMSPVSVWGYLQEMFKLKRVWK